MAKFRCADLVLYQGDDWAAMICVSNADGTDADLTGYTAQAQIRQGIADQAWHVAARLLCAIVLPNQISISLTHLQTTRLRQRAYRWDLQLVSPGGIVTTILAGEVKVTFEVTRAYDLVESGLLAWSKAEDEALWPDDEQYLVAMEEER